MAMTARRTPAKINTSIPFSGNVPLSRRFVSVRGERRTDVLGRAVQENPTERTATPRPISIDVNIARCAGSAYSGTYTYVRVFCLLLSVPIRNVDIRKLR
ncbi:hypothetical protein Trydic_g389 [Trypoxylus dichotomus]